MNKNKKISKKIGDGLNRNIVKINLLILAGSLITLNPIGIGIGVFNVTLSSLTSYSGFIKMNEIKIKKIDSVINSLKELPEEEIDEDVKKTLHDLNATKEIYLRQINNLKNARNERDREVINKKAKKLTKKLRK